MLLLTADYFCLNDLPSVQKLMENRVSHWFGNDERVKICNAVRSSITHAGLTYTEAVAWQFFLE